MTRKTRPIRPRRRYAKLAGLMAAVMLLTGVCSTLPVSAGASANNNAQMVGTYTVCRIKNAATGRYLEYGNPLSHTTGTLVSTTAKRSESDSLRNHQLWCVMQIASPDDGEAYMNENEFGLPGVADSGQTYVRKIRNYRIMPYNYMGVALDVRGGGADDGALIETYPIAINGNTEDNPAQIFQIDVSTVSPDRMYIASKCSGTSSDGTYYKGYVTDTGSSVIQHQWDSSYHTNNKTWIFEEVINDEPTYLIRNKHSKKYLQVPGSLPFPSLQLTQGLYNGDWHQQWKVIQQSNNEYLIYSLAGDGKSNLAIENSTSTPVRIYTNLINDNARWKIFRNENGTFRIASKTSNYSKVLTVQGDSTLADAPIILYDYGNSPTDQSANEQWEMIPIRNNKYTNMLGPISIKYGQENAPDKYAWAPSEGSLQAYFYDGDVNIVQTQAKFRFKIGEQVTDNFGVDVTARKISDATYPGASEMSAYFAVTNLPNPVIDLKNDKGEEDENDWYYEESEAVSKENYLITAKDYYLYTFWQDYRLGGHTGDFSLSFQKNFQNVVDEEFNGYLDTQRVARVSFGKVAGRP